ncbi:hypothetical protein ANTRET_LOCUS3819 [Anthophora retusa]
MCANETACNGRLEYLATRDVYYERAAAATRYTLPQSEVTSVRQLITFWIVNSKKKTLILHHRQSRLALWMKRKENIET